MDYFNPEQIRKKRSSFRIKLYFAFFGLALLSIGALYVLAYSPVFRLDNIKISGKNRLSDENVISLVRQAAFRGVTANFLGSNNFLAWPSGEVNVSATALAYAKISKDWLTKSVRIDIRERTRFGIWCIRENACFWFDENGTVFEEAPATEGPLIIKVYDAQNQPLTIGSKIAEERFLKNILSVLAGFKKLDFSAKKITLERSLQEIRITTYDGLSIFFSIRFDPTAAIASLKDLGKTVSIQKLNYLDLRIENRIYYKN